MLSYQIVTLLVRFSKNLIADKKSESERDRRDTRENRESRHEDVDMDVDEVDMVCCVFDSISDSIYVLIFPLVW